MVVTGEAELATVHGDEFVDIDPGRINKSRLRTDRGYLLSVVCQHFQQVDSYRRGLITAAAFSRALEAVGLRYGQREVEDLLQYCTITDDGYVHYKELLKVVGPLTPRAKQCSAKGAIFPEDFPQQAAQLPASAARPKQPSAGLVTWDGKVDEVRQIYSRWERGNLSNSGFKAALQALGLPLTDQLDHLLVIYGPSRGMPFRKLMYALQIDENDGRRARNTHGRGLRSEPPSAADFVRDRRAHLEGEGGWQRSPSSACGAESTDPADGSLRQAICDFVDGQIPAVAFRQLLRRCGVNMSTTLDRLIRRHEGDNSVRFQDFARLLLLQDKREQLSEGGGPQSEAGAEKSTLGGGYPVQTPHRGQRRDDVRSLLSHSQGAHTRSAASVGHGHRHPDDTRSVTSNQAADAFEDSHCSHPPFATAWDLSAPRPSPSQRPSSTSRSRVGGHGDIIGWKDRPHEEPPPPPPPRGTRAAALMCWTPPGEGWHEEERVSRSEKRHFGLNGNGDVPFARMWDSDHQQVLRQPPAMTPFGTDLDLRLQKPEDAGTDEYRCAVRAGRGLFE